MRTDPGPPGPLTHLLRVAGFTNVRSWLADVREHADPHLTCILVGNKIDLCADDAPAPARKREVPAEEAELFAQEEGLLFVEASAKSGENVEQAFERATRDILDKVRRGVFDDDRVSNVDFHVSVSACQREPRRGPWPIARRRPVGAVSRGRGARLWRVACGGLLPRDRCVHGTGGTWSGAVKARLDATLTTYICFRRICLVAGRQAVEAHHRTSAGRAEQVGLLLGRAPRSLVLPRGARRVRARRASAATGSLCRLFAHV